jgi:hypothetical protein
VCLELEQVCQVSSSDYWSRRCIFIAKPIIDSNALKSLFVAICKKMLAIDQLRKEISQIIHDIELERTLHHIECIDHHTVRCIISSSETLLQTSSQLLEGDEYRRKLEKKVRSCNGITVNRLVNTDYELSF